VLDARESRARRWRQRYGATKESVPVLAVSVQYTYMLIFPETQNALKMSQEGIETWRYNAPYLGMRELIRVEMRNRAPCL